jgi:hypothetical protein
METKKIRLVTLFFCIFVLLNQIQAELIPGLADTLMKAGRSLWTFDEYVDKFGDKTGEKFLSTTYPQEGVFSNSATNNSPLHVRILVEKESVDIKLFEYAGTNPVKGFLDTQTYNISVKTPPGETTDLVGYLARGSDRISLSASSAKTFIDLLKNTDNPFSEEANEWTEIKFHMQQEDGSSTYRFGLLVSDNTCSGFNERYDELLGEIITSDEDIVMDKPLRVIGDSSENINPLTPSSSPIEESKNIPKIENLENAANRLLDERAYGKKVSSKKTYIEELKDLTKALKSKEISTAESLKRLKELKLRYNK